VKLHYSDENYHVFFLLNIIENPCLIFQLQSYWRAWRSNVAYDSL